MVKIYRLQYEDKESALIDLKSKKVIDANEQYINGTESLVECGIITLVYETKTELAIIANGYHYNIMTTDTIVFESEVFPNNPKYKFAGHGN
jgi:hypothetical protein